MKIVEAIVDLIRRASCDLSPDVEDAISAFREKEEPCSMAFNVLTQVQENIALARERSLPLCQDTGTNIFFVDYPRRLKEEDLTKAVRDAVKIATRRCYLRPNSVETLTGRNTGNNIGIGHPSLHFHQWDRDDLRIRLMLKGGGSENVGAQYRLPDSRLKAGRDLKGVEKCVLDAAYVAQGEGCAPGVLGVGVGGDRGSSFYLSKEQFFRRLTDRNKVAELADLEARLMEKINQLGIGPMGLGGRTTVLGVKIGVANRLPASYFVSVSYMCWAFRRKTMTMRDGKVTYA